MAYLSQADLEAMGFKQLGCNVQISSKASIYNPESIIIGDFSRIDDFCVISGRVEIGRNVHIAVFCNVAGGELGVYFHDFSGIAYSCSVFSQSDDYTGRTLTNPTIPSKYKKEAKKPVIIGRHCIVGTHSVIFPGVVLAEGTSVGAMTMVTKSTEAWSVYSGIPAKKIKTRKMDLLMLEEQFLAECSNSPLN